MYLLMIILWKKFIKLSSNSELLDVIQNVKYD